MSERFTPAPDMCPGCLRPKGAAHEKGCPEKLRIEKARAARLFGVPQ